MTDLFLRRDLHAARQRRARAALDRLTRDFGDRARAEAVIVTADCDRINVRVSPFK